MGYGLDVKVRKYTEDDGLYHGRATYLIEEKEFYPPPENPYDAAALIIDPDCFKMEDDDGRPYILSEKINNGDGTFSLRFFLAEYAPDWLKEEWLLDEPQHYKKADERELFFPTPTPTP